jgi:UDP-N-acetylmuramate--alanine ligase
MPTDVPPHGSVSMREELDLERPRHVHVVGVGGSGMSAIAAVLAGMGHRVTGSDIKTSPVTDRLRAEGVAIMVGHDPSHVQGADIVTYSPAVRPDNVELVEARRLRVPTPPRAAVLAGIAGTRRCVAVAGTHGKTTTSSMLALILIEAGLRPSFLIGADINEMGTNAVWDEGEWLVLEADESFGAFVDLRPEIAMVMSVEPDHLDHYGTFEALQEAFGRFLAGASGPRYVGADDPVAATLGREVGARSVGTSRQADLRVAEVDLGRSSVSFELSDAGRALGRFAVPVPGLLNVRNAACAIAAAMAVGTAPEVARAALARFAGVPRRFEFRGETHGVTFVDDYAHLAQEVRSTLAAARAGGWRRIVAVFQPHRYSRTASLASSFADAFDDADEVVVTDVYGAGEAPIPGVSGKLVADAVRGREDAPPVTYAASREELLQAVASRLRPGDLCCTLGAGDLTTLPDELMAAPTW